MTPARKCTTSIAAALCMTLSVLGATACQTDPVTLANELQLEALPTPAGPRSGESNLTVDAAGNVYLTWLERGEGQNAALRFAIHDGSSWTDARTILARSDFFINWADFPSMAVLPDGRLAVHWLQRSGTGTYAYDVRIAQSTDGGESWTDGITPHTDGTQSEHGFASLFPQPGDSLGAIWLDGRKFSVDGHHESNEMMLVSTRIAADGTPGEEIVVDGRICDCCQTSVALTTNGPVVVYRDRSPAEIRDIYITRQIGGKWTEGRPVHVDGWEINACPVNGPAVSASGNSLAVAWFTAAQDTARVYVAYSADAGETFSAPVRVDGGNPVGRVGIVMRGDGSALVSWLEAVEGQRADIRMRHVSPSGQLSEPYTISSSNAGRRSGFPRIVQSGESIYFSWTAPGDSAQVNVARGSLVPR